MPVHKSLLPSLLVLPLVACGVPVSGLHAADPPASESPGGLVVAAEPLAAAAGTLMLDRGGNAIDAAVATGFALAVTYPAAGNLGGGGFLVARIADEDGATRTFALDFREVAPAAATADMYLRARAEGRESASTLGGLAAGVPGTVAGLISAHERFGRLPLREVLAPAVYLAENGFNMTRRTAGFLASPGIRAGLESDPASRRLFYPEGEPIAEGALFRQPDLARTIGGIAEMGAQGFYEGEIAALLVATMRRSGGVITLEDLAGYRPVERIPVTFPFAGHTIVTMPPPSSGGICLQQMLTMLERIGSEGAGLAKMGHNSSASLHLLAETMRRSFADRNRFLGDPDFVDLPLRRLVERGYLEELVRSIDPDRATPSADLPGGSAPGREREETTHYSVLDAEGNAVAVTTTLNGAFGGKVLVEGAGFLLNNEMDDFATEPGEPNLYGLIQGEANTIAPGKRPLSSMTPTLILTPDGAVRGVLGTPGGPTIITNVLQVILNLLVHKLPPQAAVNAPKIHHQHLPDAIWIEAEIVEDVRENLRRRGHEVRPRGWIGDFQLIWIDPQSGRALGASDPRGGGSPIVQ